MKSNSPLFSNFSISKATNKGGSIAMAVPKTSFVIVFGLNWNKQAKHVKPRYGGTHGRPENQTRSYINGGRTQAEKLFHKYYGKGTALGENKERVVLDHNVGMYFNRATGKFEKSNTIIIHYSTTGSHIVVGAPQPDKIKKKG